MTLLDQYIAANYAHRVLNQGGDVVAKCAQDIPADQLQAKRAALRGVEARCFVSRVAGEFLDQVLGARA